MSWLANLANELSRYEQSEDRSAARSREAMPAEQPQASEVGSSERERSERSGLTGQRSAAVGNRGSVRRESQTEPAEDAKQPMLSAASSRAASQREAGPAQRSGIGSIRRWLDQRVEPRARVARSELALVRGADRLTK